jgi:hypothetical protein
MTASALTEIRPPTVTRAVVLACLLVLFAGMSALAHAGCSISIDAGEAAVLADKVWGNESGRDVGKLLWWNRGEDFASLGIGHFIWYPPGVEGPFQESFPALLTFLSAADVPMPAWLSEDPAADCPWLTREQFLDQREAPKAMQLRRLLIDTVALQGAFMVARLEAALDAMLATAPASTAAIIESRFCALTSVPTGRYALVDYVNFKGEGIKPEERYAGQGWGLKQVLEEMQGTSPANVDFAQAAARVLEGRVDNAPPERREQRWLPGWRRRVDSYRRD